MHCSDSIVEAPADRSGEMRTLNAAVAVFTITIFTGSSLLFLVQPMFARLVLPRLGGSSSVWNTCVLFFQTMLLLGYVYAHVSTRYLGVRRQAALHLVVLLLPLACLPLTAGATNPAADGSPVWWLLATMTVTVGLPFFVVSTTAPLLQRWFSTFPLASARDPYFLYAASNAGSMLALLSYPFLLEPTIGVRHQTHLWTGGYVLLIALTSLCAIMTRVQGVQGFRGSEVQGFTGSGGQGVQGISVRLRWLLLAFVPSSLMLGVTTHVSSDIAAVPLMWVLPLAMYLLTFVLAFSRRGLVPDALLNRALPPLIFVTLLTIFLGIHVWWFIPLHLAAFFCAALVCHGELAARRPHVSHLTEFYLWMSFGGMLGGVFNTLVAPQIFATILEYPLMLALVVSLRVQGVQGFRGSAVQVQGGPSGVQGGPSGVQGVRGEPLPVIAGVAVIVLICGAYLSFGAPSPETTGKLVAGMVGLSLPVVFAKRAGAFGAVALAFVAVLAMGRPSSGATVLFVGRSFFGMHRVIESSDRTYRTLQHGSTVHGRQQLAGESDCQPTSYYLPVSPIGQLFTASAARSQRVGIIGLGSGGLACYGKEGERWTFYEIDPMVEHIATNPAYFTQLRNSRAEIDVVLGDGRITLQDAPPSTYDVLILDAFSSDAIPVHLLTREALQLYLSRLAPGGVIALHVSNRYLDLEPMLGALVRAEGLSALANIDNEIPADEAKKGRLGSHWVMIAREPTALASLAGRPGWRTPTVNTRVRPWTDDYSNILSVLRDKG